MYAIRTTSFVASLCGLAIVLVTGKCCADERAPAEWSQWRGPERNGISQETGLRKSWDKGGPPLVWKATGLGGGYSTPSFAGGKIFGMSYRDGDEVVWAREVATGKELWNTRIAKATQVQYGEGSRSTPTVDGDVLFALGVAGDLVCLELATGRERWHRHLAKDFGGNRPGWGYSESPLVDGDQVACTPGGNQGAIVALDKRTGEVIWRSRDYRDNAAYASLVIATIGGVRQYIQMTHHSVAGVAADDGRLLWRYERQGPTAAVPTPLVSRNSVYATSGYGAGCHMIQIQSTNGGFTSDEVYANKTMTNHHGGVVLVDDHVFGFSDGKGWVCQNFKTGAMVWNERGKLGKGSVTFADGHLYARSEGGTVALIEASPNGFVEKGRFEQPDRSQYNAWPHPVVAGGRLYLRDQDLLLCYDVKKTGAAAGVSEHSSTIVPVRATAKAESVEMEHGADESVRLPGRSVRTATVSRVTGSATAGDWPQWRGPDRNGISQDTGLLKQWPQGGPPLLWTATGMGSGHASVAVADGRIYGAGGRGGAQYMTCVDASDGKVVWSSPIGQPGDEARSTPTIDGDLLFVLSTHGQQDADIVCLETATGKERWRKSFRNDFKGRMQSSWGYSESPLVDGDHVICTPGGSEATLVALKKSSGEVIWKAKVPGGDAAAYASIVAAEVGGVRLYVQLLEKGLVGVAAKNGKFLWRYDRIANSTANIPTPIVRGDLVFCSTGYNTGAALLRLNATGGGVRFQERYFIPANKFQNHHGGMVLVGDHIYSGSGHNNGLPTCIELKSGKIVWGPQRGPGTESAAVAYADGHLYFRYQNAVVALIEASPKGFKLKGSFKIPKGQEPSWSHPVVAGGRLYLRDQDRLFCYDVRDRSVAQVSSAE